MFDGLIKSLIPTLLQAMGYEKAQFDAGLDKAEKLAGELQERILNAEQTLTRLESKIDILISQGGKS